MSESLTDVVHEAVERAKADGERIDPAAIMAKHGDPNWHYQCWCQANTEGTWPCETYRLAEALIASEAKVTRVETFAARLVADGYSTCIYESAAEMGEIIRAALADQTER